MIIIHRVTVLILFPNVCSQAEYQWYVSIGIVIKKINTVAILGLLLQTK